MVSKELRAEVKGGDPRQPDRDRERRHLTSSTAAPCSRPSGTDKQIELIQRDPRWAPQVEVAEDSRVNHHRRGDSLGASATALVVLDHAAVAQPVRLGGSNSQRRRPACDQRMVVKGEDELSMLGDAFKSDGGEPPAPDRAVWRRCRDRSVGPPPMFPTSRAHGTFRQWPQNSPSALDSGRVSTRPWRAAPSSLETELDRFEEPSTERREISRSRAGFAMLDGEEADRAGRLDATR